MRDRGSICITLKVYHGLDAIKSRVSYRANAEPSEHSQIQSNDI